MNYKIRIGQYSIGLGTKIDLDNLKHDTSVSQETRSWDIPAKVYRAKDIVREVGTLLEAVCIQLGDDTLAEPLLNNVQASLNISGREAVLPLVTMAQGDQTKSEFLEQAQKIGVNLSEWAREIYQESRHDRHEKKALSQLILKSRCDQHLWTTEVANILMGPNGSPIVMQLFNEYLHQLVLLRDALLPFENWEEVPIPILDGRQTVGLRFIESARDRFISQLIVRKIPNKEIVRFAQSLLCTGLEGVGYGFQYCYGTVLPVVLGSSPVNDVKSILRWYPVHLLSEEDISSVDGAIFDYVYEDYDSAPRSWISAVKQKEEKTNGETRFNNEAEIVPFDIKPKRILLRLRLWKDNREYDVDLGQVLRGYRYMYRPVRTFEAEPINVSVPQERVEHKASDILKLPGLVASHEDSNYYIDTQGNLLVMWALLGKLLPQNVVVLSSDNPDEWIAALRSGKKFGAKFLIMGFLQ